ncbi:hypothetical protein BT69DRAFT_1285624 [Atractiella rhizophila]|nr:hypothetical protein BT69DRAFT_1285624 [Atractiella rhizophila]
MLAPDSSCSSPSQPGDSLELSWLQRQTGLLKQFGVSNPTGSKGSGTLLYSRCPTTDPVAVA